MERLKQVGRKRPGRGGGGRHVDARQEHVAAAVEADVLRHILQQRHRVGAVVEAGRAKGGGKGADSGTTTSSSCWREQHTGNRMEHSGRAAVLRSGEETSAGANTRERQVGRGKGDKAKGDMTGGESMCRGFGGSEGL